LFQVLDLRVVVLALTAGACAQEGEYSTFQPLYEDVLVPKCATSGCHNATTGAAELFLEGERAYDSLVNSPCSNPDADALGLVRVDPGLPENSFLYVKVTEPGILGLLMPIPPADPLEEWEVAAIEEWVLAGAQP